MTTVYIAGKIGGLDYFEAYSNFHKAEIELSLKNFVSINPMKLPHLHDRSWKSYMKEDLRALKECDALYALDNWQDSRGARIEVWFAKRYGKAIIYQSNGL